MSRLPFGSFNRAPEEVATGRRRFVLPRCRRLPAGSEFAAQTAIAPSADALPDGVCHYGSHEIRTFHKADFFGARLNESKDCLLLSPVLNQPADGFEFV
jgi:hypothetical protein